MHLQNKVNSSNLSNICYKKIRLILSGPGNINPGCRIFKARQKSIKNLETSKSDYQKIMRECKYSGPTFVPNEHHQIGFLTSTWYSQRFGKYVGIGFIKVDENDNLPKFCKVHLSQNFYKCKKKYGQVHENLGNFLCKNSESLQMYHASISLV